MHFITGESPVKADCCSSHDADYLNFKESVSFLFEPFFPTRRFLSSVQTVSVIIKYATGGTFTGEADISLTTFSDYS